jgi:hypothetical protein
MVLKVIYLLGFLHTPINPLCMLLTKSITICGSITGNTSLIHFHFIMAMALLVLCLTTTELPDTLPTGTKEAEG